MNAERGKLSMGWGEGLAKIKCRNLEEDAGSILHYAEALKGKMQYAGVLGECET